MRDQIGLPNPIENRRTFTPKRRATQKWPNSWNVTSTPSVTSSHHAEPKNSLIQKPAVIRRRIFANTRTDNYRRLSAPAGRSNKKIRFPDSAKRPPHHTLRILSGG